MTPFEQAVALLASVHPIADGEALIEIRALPQKGTGSRYRRSESRFFIYPHIAAEWALEKNVDRYEVHMGVNPRIQMRGKGEDIAVVSSLVMDLDVNKGANVPAVLGFLTLHGLAPSIVVWSGHGVHVYLLLTVPVHPDEAAPQARRLCRAGGIGSDSVHDAARVLRLAGTINWKDPNYPSWSFLTSFNPERRYDLAFIAAALDAAGVPQADPERRVRPVEPSNPPRHLDELLARLREDARSALLTGQRPAHWIGTDMSHSSTDYRVICALVRVDATDEQIRWLYDNMPIGANRYRVVGEGGAGYLDYTIRKVRRELGTEEPAPEPEVATDLHPGLPRDQISHQFMSGHGAEVTWFGIAPPPRHRPHVPLDWMGALPALPNLPPELFVNRGSDVRGN